VDLEIIEDTVTEILALSGLFSSVKTLSGREIHGNSAILATGTFLNGVIYYGGESFPCGRSGEPASTGLVDSLKKLGFRISRFKTGTPPRIDKHSIDYSGMEEQPGIQPPRFFSTAAASDNEMFHVEHSEPDSARLRSMFHVEQFLPAMRPWQPGSNQIPCFLTHTTPKTHEIIASNLKSSALYGGYITSTGVRYCPSIEDKIVKFPGRDRHHVFIEPEGRFSLEMYPNGISNSLPRPIQDLMVHSIPGLENAVITQYGYAIEYDYYDPTQLTASLESKFIENLYCAGQINGTTGYEEAAVQGFIAGVNAVFKIRGQPPLAIGRHDGYIGVLIDDLITKGVDEPYRMFTSRSEHRLILRNDNACLRMLPAARRIGIVRESQIRCFDEIQRLVAEEL